MVKLEYIAPRIAVLVTVIERGFALSDMGNLENPENGGEIH